LGGALGILQRDPNAFLQGTPSGAEDGAAIDKLIAERNAARKSRDFATADRIRRQLDEMKVVLEDSAGGTTWRRR